MLAGQAWRLLQNPSSLCARVLSARYYPDGSILEAMPSSGISYAWRSILKGIQLLKKGIIWRVGSGENINIWCDPWIPRGSTRRVITQKGNNLVTKVNELIDPITNKWDEDLVKQTFNHEDTRIILQIPIQDHIEDFMAWHYDKKKMKMVVNLIGVSYGQCPFQIKCFFFYGASLLIAYRYGQSYKTEVKQEGKGLIHQPKRRWTRPPPGFLKINTDAAFHLKSNDGGWGFIIRDDQGTALAAGAGNLKNVADVLHSEAMAMFYAINTAIQMGCDRVVFETDSAQLKIAVSTEEYDLSALGATFREIKIQLRVGFADVCVVTCSRACNLVAHNLAAYGAKLNSDECVTWLGQLPEFVLNFVTGDLASDAM